MNKSKLYAQNQVTKSELAVLECLKVHHEGRSESPAIAEVTDLSTNTGIRDKDEILRALYTLEGKRFVSPFPAGDLTSQTWHITDHGVKALGMLD